MAREGQQTPMMEQYHRIKEEIPAEALLLFRLGDFYELFFQDAEQGAQILNVALTKRGDVPMCGIPYHASQGYISRLLKAGKKVAICEQAEEPRPGHLVKRQVTQILSPGTHFDDRLLQDEQNNYLTGVFGHGKGFGLATIDLTTGDFKATELTESSGLLTELERLGPAEVIYPSEQKELGTTLGRVSSQLSPYEDWTFSSDTACHTLLEHFQVATLDGFGLKSRDRAVAAAGGVMHYLTQHLRRDLQHITRLTYYESSDYLRLDTTSLRNLEILEPRHPDAPHAVSLYRVLNRTVTPMGSRCLRDWLTQPLANAQPIHARQQAVEDWLGCPTRLDSFRKQLAGVKDLERILSRLSTGSGNARDLVALRQGLEQLPDLRRALKQVATKTVSSEQGPDLGLNGDPHLRDQGEEQAGSTESLLTTLHERISELPEIVDLLSRALVEEPPIALKEGGLIRDGFDESLDELRAASREGKTWIAELQQKEIERTQIPSLKVRYNSVFGYYIEVTKANLDKVPEDYIRKQTISNGERYITPELKEVEGKVLGADERAMKLEYDLFQRLRQNVLSHLNLIQASARALAQVDVLTAFAELARLHRYSRPEVRDEGVLRIREGRHPALDHPNAEHAFVPNDTDLDTTDQQVALITGPNMAGKSTYIRQVALLTLLAHTGSFIPASEARVDLIDRIFTRIGASDDLAQGQSTFMVEMSETANLLNNASTKSLIILDEIGRGTSTFDGLSLAWSIVEHLHNAVGAKTLFATHYHELTELASRLPRIANYNVAVREWGDQVIFLHKIMPGGSDKSYGIQVARLAGIPKPVLDRAKVILNNLEASELTPAGGVRQPQRQRSQRQKLKDLPESPQLDLFADAE